MTSFKIVSDVIFPPNVTVLFVIEVAVGLETDGATIAARVVTESGLFAEVAVW